MVKIVLVYLHEFDGKRPYVGKVWVVVLKTIEMYMKSLKNPPFLFLVDYAMDALNAFYACWDTGQ